MKQHLLSAFCIVMTAHPLSFAQPQYIWPTDAGYAITSSFAESRPGRFHAGIDVKTWGREGYGIFAVRDGVVSKIGVSPFGYGRVIYLTLDTGEIVVYAHLQRFRDDIEAYVYAAQERLGRFSVQLYPTAAEFIVKQGDLLGYTGQTGVGYPHLHFEVRDAANRPINPFSRDYRVEDSIKPTITAVAVTPLDAGSMVDDDWAPAIFPAEDRGNGQFVLPRPVMANGTIAFGVSAYDMTNLAENKFGTYCNELYLDDSLVFRARYDRFDYGENIQSNLDRDVRLIMRGKGTFYKLFRDVGNTLSFYPDKDVFYGIAYFACGEENSTAGLNRLPDWHQQEGTASGIRYFTPGMHQFKIVLYDFWGNSSQVTGLLYAGSRPELQCERQNDPLTDAPMLLIKSAALLSECSVFISQDASRTWQAVHHIKKPDSLVMSGDETLHFRIPLDEIKSPLLKIVARDHNGFDSHPVFITLNEHQSAPEAEMQPCFAMKADYYDYFVRLEFTRLCDVELEKVVVWDSRGAARQMTLVASSPSLLTCAWPLTATDIGPVPVELTVIGPGGTQMIQREWLDFTCIAKGQAKRVATDDDLCAVDFDARSLFNHIFVRSTVSEPESATQPVVGQIYNIEPKDVPLNGGVTVTIKYPPSDSLAYKLAIFMRSNGDRWNFIGNRLKKAEHAVSASSSSLGSFCLMRDVIAPEILSLSPAQGAHLSTTQPVLRFTFKDELSGIQGEDDMSLKLDGVKLIAEYDPERHLLFNALRTPLSKGKHVLEGRVNDRCGNVAVRAHIFWIE